MNELKKYLPVSGNPEGDWKIIFTVTVTLVILVGVLNVYMFIKVNKGEFFTVEDAGGETETLNAETLRQTLSYYRGKAINFENILSGTTTSVSDPSI